MGDAVKFSSNKEIFIKKSLRKIQRSLISLSEQDFGSSTSEKGNIIHGSENFHVLHHEIKKKKGKLLCDDKYSSIDGDSDGQTKNKISGEMLGELNSILSNSDQTFYFKLSNCKVLDYDCDKFRSPILDHMNHLSTANQTTTGLPSETSPPLAKVDPVTKNSWNHSRMLDSRQCFKLSEFPWWNNSSYPPVIRKYHYDGDDGPCHGNSKSQKSSNNNDMKNKNDCVNSLDSGKKRCLYWTDGGGILFILRKARVFDDQGGNTVQKLVDGDPKGIMTAEGIELLGYRCLLSVVLPSSVRCCAGGWQEFAKEQEKYFE